ncbi:putative hpp family protein [Venturia nashicola]|uniref:Putative hpp family protein n=1 Tax=Venturia nashicola TaxID=86259 RepID=A0A4Z1NX51_9PEZI|nr:putative hpp family protein [Venturia nashicola]TLD30205.1 putative hpp family protein [Venturia nashicola]
MGLSSNYVPAASNVHFDIDDYLNRICLPSQTHKLPTSIARFLGWRKNPPKPIGNIIVALYAFLGAFTGLIVVGATYRYSPLLQEDHIPVIFASLGATAILNYNTIASPLAQPRNSLLGQTFSALIGVSIAKLFGLLPTHSQFLALRWVAGPIACGLASAVMTMTNTVHPPGGATAVLAIIDGPIQAMGWMFVPLILLGSVLMFLVALLVNNIQRVFPVFWWTPKDVGKKTGKDVEKNWHEKSGRENERKIEHAGFEQMIVLSGSGVVVPEGFALGMEEEQVLEDLRNRLRHWGGDGKEGQEDERHFVSGSETTHVENGRG